MTYISDELLDELRATGDAVADECVLAILGGGREPAVVGELIAELNERFPRHPAIDSYLVATGRLPDWTDVAAVGRGQALFERESAAVMTVLGFGALPESYCNAAVARELNRHSTLGVDPLRRVRRTAEFVRSVMSPGGLGDGADGRRAIQRVRLLHAALRLSGEPGTRPESPSGEARLNQEDLAATLLTLSWMTAIRLPRVGVQVDARTLYDYAHSWNVAGSLLGIDERLLPASADAAAELAEAIRRRRYQATPEGAALANALLDIDEVWAPAGDLRALVRQLLGHELAAMIAV
ncbi:MAG: DUF2236 domain-containing protein [Dehalococcoidia bacterium]|nr:DUF2236 domain-containing protein [Dehalococcoidia bacterium]